MKEVQRRRATRPRTHSQKVALLRVDPSYFKSSAQAVPETHPPLWGHHTDRSAGAAPQCQSLHCTCTPQPSVRPSCGGQLRGPHVRRPHLWRAHLRHGLLPSRLLCSWDSPAKNTGVGCHALLQGIFPTQGLNPGLLHCRQILYQPSHQGSPRILEWVAYPFSRGSEPLLPS